MRTLSITRFLILLPMFFLFLPSMYIPGGIPVYDVVIGIIFILFLLSNKNVFIIKQIVKFTKIKPVKILIFYVSWIVFSGIILIACGKYNVLYALYAILILFMYNNLLWFLYPSLVFPRFFSMNMLIKFLMVGIYLVCIYGLFVYIFNSIGVPLLKPIHYILVNRRLSDLSFNSFEIINRVLSVFEEPGYLGAFLCINLPIIYSTIFSKYKILKNNTLNMLLKKTYIPILWLTIILIRSPIWLIFSLLSTIIYLKKQVFTLVKKFAVVILIITIVLSLAITHFSFNSVDISESYLSRIERTIHSYGDMNTFVNNEPSLANRVLSYIVRFKIFCKYPITGIGYKNTEYNAKEVYYNYGLPLTLDSQINLNTKSNKMGMNGAIFWDILSDCGIIGIILFYSFLLSLITSLNRIIKILDYSIYKLFAQGLKNTYILILIFSVYDIRPNFHYFWFLYGITLCYANCFKYKQEKIYLKGINRC